MRSNPEMSFDAMQDCYCTLRRADYYGYMLRFFTVTIHLISHLSGVVFVAIFRRLGPVQSVINRSSASICERLGGAFPKAGQILSTRADLIGDELRSSLSELQDKVAPLSEKVATSVLEQAWSAGTFVSIARIPVASATIAQVHEAKRADDGRRVALKLMRPGVRQKLIADCRIIRFFGRFIARLPKMSSIPVNEALVEASEVLVNQTDFRDEARNHLRLHAIFADSNGVLIPTLHEDLCTDTVLVMDYIPGMKKLSDPTLSDPLARQALTIGVRALYKMIFEEGFIHCDMHPGNVLVAPDERLVILDAGFMVELTNQVRRSFAEFFLAIAFRDGSTAAKIVRETALRLPPDLSIETFERDITDLINRVGGLRARDFQVAGFVGELFAIMHKHHIYGTSQFTLIILSLLVYEGVTKQRYPDLNFQQEAIPFVMAALANKNEP